MSSQPQTRLAWLLALVSIALALALPAGAAAAVPVVQTTAGLTAYTENGAAVLVDNGLTVSDSDDVNLESLRVKILSGVQLGDVLTFNPGPLTGSYSAVKKTITLSGSASLATYQTVLRSVAFNSTNNNPVDKVIEFKVNDGGAAFSAPATKSITVTRVNDKPLVKTTAGSTAYTEAAAPVAIDPAVTVSDPDDTNLESLSVRISLRAQTGDVLSFSPGSLSGSFSSATNTLTLSGSAPVAEYQTVLRSVSFSSTNVNPVNKMIEFKVNDGDVDSLARTKHIAVTRLNEAPIIWTTTAYARAYTEGDGAKIVDGGVTPSDFGSLLTGAKVTIREPEYDAIQDSLALPVTAGMVGNFDSSTGVLTVSTTGGAMSVEAFRAALRTVTYTNSSEGPSPLTRSIAFQVIDDMSAPSNEATRAIAITAVNDPPTAVDDAGTTDEDTPLNVAAPGVLANDTDVDPGDTKTVVALNGSATLTGSTAEGGSVTISANGSYTYTPPSAFQAMSTGQSDTDSFQYTMRDGAGAQSTATVDITVEGVSDDPVAVADSFNAVGNTGLFVGTTRPSDQAGKEITGSVLSNDTDPDTPSANLVAQAVTNAPTTLGGAITIEADGNFTYHPDDADTGDTDTYTYTVCDTAACDAGTGTGTLNLPIDGQVWYVRNNQAAGGDGTSDAPFDTLLEAETASATSDTVYVFDGDNTPNNLHTGYVMEANERLIGESRPLALDPDGGGSLPTVALYPGTAASVPTLTASNEDVVSLAAGVTVDGFSLDPSGTGGGIAGGAAAGDVTVARVDVVDTGTAGTQPGIELDGTTGVNRFTDVTVTNGGSATAIGVRLNNADRVLFTSTATNTISTTAAKALDAASTNLLTSRWNDITVTGSGSGAIRLSSTTGSPVLGDGAGTDLALQTTSGTTAALDIASSNSVSVDTGGADTISATGGPAADIRNSNGSTFDFDSVSSTSSAGDGINLDTNLQTPFTATIGAISGAEGTAVDVNGGGLNGDVSYGGQINDGPGPLSVELTNRTGGAATFSGNIGDSADAGGGILLSGNTGGTTTFSGTSKVLNTGAATAVSSTGSTLSSTLSFTNGGLDIDAMSGAGFHAAIGGTVNVTGAGNTLDTQTGNALFLDNTNIGASNVTFQRISVNGAAVGIRANATGAAGRLIVTGNGGTCTAADTSGCTGGQLANLTGADNSTTTPSGTGIMLNNTLNPSFTRMWIHGASNYGIRGTNVAGFTMADSVINGSNGTTALTANKDGSVRFEELTGTVNMTNTAISGGYFTNLMVDNTAGVLNATLDNVDSGTINATGGDDAVQFEGIGTSEMDVNYKNSAFTTASGDLLQYIGDGTGGGDLDLTNNTFTNNEPSIATGGGGVALVAGAKGGATMDVLNNTMRDSLTNALTIIKSRDNAAGTHNLVANITGNTIGVAAIANSGSQEGDGMEITTFGDGNATFNVTNNTLRQYNSSAIQFVAGSGVADSGQFNLNISGNSAANPGTNPLITLLQGIRVDSGVDAADTFATCVDFGPNSITGSSDQANKDFRLVASQSTTIRQPGYAGGATDGPAFAAFAAGQIGGGAQGTAVANSPATFSGTGTTCP